MAAFFAGMFDIFSWLVLVPVFLAAIAIAKIIGAPRRILGLESAGEARGVRRSDSR